MASIKLKFDFFQVGSSNDESQSLLNSLATVAAMPNDQNRNVTLAGYPVRAASLLSERSLWFGDMQKIRLNNLPTKASLNGVVNQLDFDDDEGIGEHTAFVFRTSDRVLGVQRNHYGVPASRIIRYFHELAPAQEMLPVISPFIRTDTLRRFASMNEVKKIEMRIAGVDDPSKIANADSSLEHLASLGDLLKAPYISFSASVGNQKKHLSIASIKSFVQSVLGSQNATALRVSGDAGELDLLQDRIFEEVEITVAGDRIDFLSFEQRKLAISEALRKAAQELSTYAPLN